MPARSLFASLAAAAAASSAIAIALFASVASGQQAQARKPSLQHVEAGAGQLALSVETEAAGFRVSACPRSPCSSASPTAVAFPGRFGGASPDFRVVTLERGRKAVVAVLTDAESGQRWVTVLAAPLAGGAGAGGQDGKVRVVFNDLADPDANPRAAEPNGVQVFTDGSTSQLVVGGRREEVTLCGRAALLGPRVLDPADLELKSAKVQRLSSTDRGRARRVVAERRSKPRKAPLGRLLSSAAASSAVGLPSALTDGDPETTWSEARGGEGRGEFVTMRAPPEVLITSVAFTVRPPTKGPDDGASPRKFYLALDGELVEVTLPEDAWQHPGATYDVTLPDPISTTCLAVVLDEAFSGKDQKKEQVTLAEVEARTALDDTTDLRGLVAMLAGGGKPARAAQAILMRGGPAAFAAVADDYSVLDDAGRVLALDVSDQASCEVAAPVYVQAMGSSFEAEVVHGRTRLERCRKASVPALAAAIKDKTHPARMRAAEELSVISPADTVEILASLLAQPDSGPLPKGLRAALARAARSPKAAPALIKLFADPALPPRAALSLLRAGGDRVGDEAVRAAAAQALGRVASPGSPFDERYLALEPAAQLAAQGDEASRALLEASLADPDAHLRAAAARVASPVVSLRQRLLSLSADPEPRVREAVALAWLALAQGPGRGAARGGAQGAASTAALPAEAIGALGSMLRDEWTFVRQASYDALALAGPDQAVDSVLLGRLADDKAPLSLARAVEAVSRRRIASAGPQLLSLATDDKRSLDVRARAFRALGEICYRPATSKITDVARAGAEGTSNPDVQALSSSALVALGRLHPADLADRLAPLRGEGSPRSARAAAQAALDEADRCP